MREWRPSVALTLIITAVLTLVLLPSWQGTAAAVSCSGHSWVAGGNGDGIARAGVASGVTHDDGMYLGAGVPSCFRVTSIEFFKNNNNLIELGATKDQTGTIYCYQPPTDGDWYRFWLEIVGGTVHCVDNSNVVHQSDNLYHQVRIYRDSASPTDYHLYWGTGNWVLLTAPTWSGAQQLGNAERADHASGDSMYSIYDSTDYMDTSGNYHLWSSIAQMTSPNDDPDYSISLFNYGYKVHN